MGKQISVDDTLVYSNNEKVLNIYTNVDGTVRPMWTYEWEIGDWGECSELCGGRCSNKRIKM